jgi:hypothetical protein
MAASSALSLPLLRYATSVSRSVSLLVPRRLVYYRPILDGRSSGTTSSKKPAAAGAAAAAATTGGSSVFPPSSSSGARRELVVSPSDLVRFMDSPWAAWMDLLHIELPGLLAPGNACFSFALL